MSERTYTFTTTTQLTQEQIDECVKEMSLIINDTIKKDAIKKYTEEDIRKSFEAGYELAAKHETNQPQYAMELEDFLKTL